MLVESNPTLSGDLNLKKSTELPNRDLAGIQSSLELFISVLENSFRNNPAREMVDYIVASLKVQ